MPNESRGQALLIDRCWSIYLLLTEAFAVPSSFHVEFPALVERALVSGLLQLTVRLPNGHTLYLREEYQLTEHQFEIRHYSYAFTP